MSKPGRRERFLAWLKRKGIIKGSNTGSEPPATQTTESHHAPLRRVSTMGAPQFPQNPIVEGPVVRDPTWLTQGVGLQAGSPPQSSAALRIHTTSAEVISRSGTIPFDEWPQYGEKSKDEMVNLVDLPVRIAGETVVPLPVEETLNQLQRDAVIQSIINSENIFPKYLPDNDDMNARIMEAKQMGIKEDISTNSKYITNAFLHLAHIFAHFQPTFFKAEELSSLVNYQGM